MIILGVVVVVLVLGALLAWGTSRADVPGTPAAVGTQSARPLPEGPLHARDIDELRLDQAVRGYRVEQVDRALARLAQELAERDAEIDRLRGQQDGEVPAATVPPQRTGGSS